MRELYKQIKEGETILWEGRPDARSFFVSNVLGGALVFGLIWGIVGLCFFVFFLSQMDETPLPFLLMVLAFAAIWLSPLWIGLFQLFTWHKQWSSIYYILTDKRVLTVSGYYNKHFSSIYYRNVLDVHISEGIMDRKFGVADVSISLAGHSDEHHVLRGVEAASSLVDIIQEGMSK